MRPITQAIEQTKQAMLYRKNNEITCAGNKKKYDVAFSLCRGISKYKNKNEVAFSLRNV